MSCFKINYRGFVSMKLIGYFLIYKQQNVNDLRPVLPDMYNKFIKASAYNSIKHLLNVEIIMFHS